MNLETLLIKATSEIKESNDFWLFDIWASLINKTVEILRETGSIVRARAYYIMEVQESKVLMSYKSVMEIHDLFYATKSRERKSSKNISVLKVVRKTKKKFNRMEAIYHTRV